MTLPVVRYRKIPGDKCAGGVNPERKEIDIKKKCVSDLLDPQLQVRTLNPEILLLIWEYNKVM